MADETSGLSRSVEDYLKAIYSLQSNGVTASTSAIAETLDIQPASVTGMFKRLAESGYVEHVPYRGVELTPTGERAALRILRRHRILETYLTQRLDFPWEAVHKEAERLEHAASDSLIERMAEALGNPSHDPHGAPIPTPTGEVEATQPFTLAELAAGEEAEVRAVRDDDSAGLQAAQKAELLPGTWVRVLGRMAEPPALEVQTRSPDGPVTLIPMGLAGRVFVIHTKHGDSRPRDE
jgi:DtxR family Mn-dependent transcriptional regulator